MADPVQTTPFDDIAANEAQAQQQQTVWDDIAKNQQDALVEKTKEPTNTTTFLTALARTDPSKDPVYQLGQDSIESARNVLRLGQEKQFRNELAIKQQDKQLVGLTKLRTELQGTAVNLGAIKSVDEAYSRIARQTTEQQSQISIEQEAVDRIHYMAAKDPVQARVLLDNLEKGDADKTMRDYNIRMFRLHGIAEKLDQEYNQQGWGSTVLNFALNLVPTNYNFARSGVVGENSFKSLFAVGAGLRDQSERLQTMPMDEFIKFTAEDGDLLKSIRSNATTAFDLTSDPGAAKDIIDSLIGQTDHQRDWNNVWGGVEVASAIPFTKIGSFTRSLIKSGAPKDALRNLDNAVRMMDEAGPEAMTKATGVTEKEVIEESSVSAIHPRPKDEVPLATSLADHQAAADQALKEVFTPPTGHRFATTEELQAAFESTVDSTRAKIGRPIKDYRLVQEELPGGQQVHYVEYTFGKADGHGFASESAARRSAKYAGLGDAEPIQVADTATEVGQGADRVLINSGKFQSLIKSNGDDLAKSSRSVRDNIAKELSAGNKVFYNVEGKNIEITRATKEGMYDTKGQRWGLLGLAQPVRGTEETITVVAKSTTKEPLLADKIKAHLSSRGARNFQANRALSDAEDTTRNVHANDDLGRGLSDADVYKVDKAWGNWWKKQDPFTRKRYKDNPEEAGKLYDDFVNEYIVRNQEKGQHASVASPQRELAKGVTPEQAAKEPLNDNFKEIFRDESGQFFLRGRQNIAEQSFYVNPLTPESQGFLSKSFGRFVRAAPRITDTNLHGRALEGGTYIGRAHKVVSGNIMSAFGSLPKESRQLVEQVALKGNRDARWFKPVEVETLIERLTGRQATEQELEGYAKFRIANDMDWRLRNTEAYVNGVVEGKESFAFKTRWGQEIDKDGIIDYELSQIPTERVYDTSKNVHYTKQNNPLTRDKLEKMKSDGYVMVNLPEGMKLPDGTMVNKVLIKKHEIKISPLREEQLAYSEGGHRMYADKVFVKQGKKGLQPDTGTEYLQAPGTVRTATNIAEGRKWAAVMERARLAVKENPHLSEQVLDDKIFLNDSKSFPTGREFLEGIADDTYNVDHPFEAVYDREMPEMYRKSGDDISRLYSEDELGVNGYYRTTGRMYTSTKGEVLRHTSGEVADVLDPYDTLSRSLEQITRKLGLQNYRLESMERFKKTYGQYLDKTDGRSSYAVLDQARVRPDVPVELRNQIEAQRAAIKQVLRFETPMEKQSRQTWRNAAEWALGDGDNAARKFAHDAINGMKSRNPISFMRGLAFDAKLGVFNVGQLLIQASTMVAATALSPTHGWSAMKGLFPMHAYLLSKGSENVLEAMSKKGIGKLMGFSSSEEFKDYARHAFDHGFMDMNGSHVMVNDFGPAAHFGSFGSKVDKAREHGRVFFYTAETWNRLVSYRIAWGEAVEKGLKPSDPNFTSTLLKTADDYSFNMTGESAAFWQKGVLSLPTQFWAYNMRMLDAMAGKRFTGAQRMRLIASQAALAGTAGVPGVQALSEYIKQKHGSSPGIDTLAGMADRGVVDALNYQLTGQDILIGDRIGTGSWITQTVKTLFGQSEYGEKSFAEVAGGATYSIGTHMVGLGGGVLKSLALYSAAESGSDMAEKSLVKDKALELLKEVSTFSNITKAVMVHNLGMYQSNKGTVQVSGLPEGNAIYAALSFRPAKAQETGYMMEYLKDKSQVIKDVSTQLRNWRQESLTNPDKMEENMAKANFLIKTVPVQDRAKVIKQTNNITDQSFYDHVERKVSEEKLRDEAAQGIEE